MLLNGSIRVSRICTATLVWNGDRRPTKPMEALIEPKSFYWPYLLGTVLLTEVAIHETYIYYNVIDNLSMGHYLQYWVYLFPPFLFLLTVSIYTPEKEDDTKEYFNEKAPYFGAFLILFLASHFIRNLEMSSEENFFRALLIPAIAFFSYKRNKYSIVIILALWLVLFLYRAGVIEFARLKLGI